MVEEWAYPVPGLSAGTVRRNGASELALNAADEGLNLAVPRRGHVLSTVVEIYAKPIREAVSVVSGSLEGTQCGEVHALLLSPRRERPEPDFTRSHAEMAAWAIVSMWVVGVAAKVLSASATLTEAEQWFFGPCAGERLTSLASDRVLRKAEATLRTQADATAYFELLPYVLDPHGPGSRLSVRCDPATHSARKRKRAEGVFYTPADVAEYMVCACLDSAQISENAPTVFDPACGTGVFLRASLQQVRMRQPEKDVLSLACECLFGADIDPWPLDATAFVLLCDSWNALAGQGTVPVEGWLLLRRNLACSDTLRIDPAEGTPQMAGKNARNDRAEASRFSISRLFPALKRGPTVILGNPPYADLGRRADLTELGSVYETVAIKPQPNAEIYLPFIEQMIRLADQEICSGALVLPLSVACNVGLQFSAARELISKTRGRWRFAFFDREPHALFGEDVKTRNTIMLWSRTPLDTRPVLSTGPLRKWRGDSRAAMFRSLRFTVVDGDIRAGIPKIEGDCQAAALRTLSMRWARLEQVAQSIGRVGLGEMSDSENSSFADDRSVFVGPTAYNFLNVMLRPWQSLLHGGQALSEHTLHVVRCTSKKNALAVYAVLSSRLAYWWWHTHGDGFHVSRRFIAEMPFGGEEFTEKVTCRLSKHGAELWSAIKTKPIISLNRGRTSLAYTPNGHDDIRRKIDQVLVELAGLEGAFIDELQQFTARTVTATLREATSTKTDE